MFAYVWEYMSEYMGEYLHIHIFIFSQCSLWYFFFIYFTNVSFRISFIYSFVCSFTTFCQRHLHVRTIIFILSIIAAWNKISRCECQSSHQPRRASCDICHSPQDSQCRVDDLRRVSRCTSQWLLSESVLVLSQSPCSWGWICIWRSSNVLQLCPLGNVFFDFVLVLWHLHIKKKKAKSADKKINVFYRTTATVTSKTLKYAETPSVILIVQLFDT